MGRKEPQTDEDGARAEASGLVEAVATRRDRAAFARLFELFAPRIKSYLLRLGQGSAEAEELTQETMLTLWRRAETYDPRRSSVATWIFTIARNKRIDALRRDRHPEFDFSDPALAPDPAPSAVQKIETEEVQIRLLAAITVLPTEQRELLELAFFQDLSHRDIARTRNLPLGTVKSRLRLALARLRGAVDKDGL